MPAYPENIINEGVRLREILEDQQIKIVDFARKAGFTNQIAHYYLRKSEIKRSTLERFCTLLGITLEEFYQWNNHRNPLKKYSPIEIEEEFHHGRRLQKLIQQKGLNKSRLAARLQISRRALYNLLERKSIELSQLEKICEALSISLEEFLHDSHVSEATMHYQQDSKWKDKYYQLLEDHNKVLKEMAALKEKLKKRS